MLKPENRDSKKVYSSPKLTTYGTVQKLTQKKGLRANPDGGRFPRYKTHI
jgi:hypothetical protein